MEEKNQELNDLLQERGYILQQYIGSGAYGSVFLVKSIRYGTDFVIKRIEQEPSTSTPQDDEQVNSEVQTLKNLSHPNIISIYEYFSTGNAFFIVLEYCVGGSCDDMIKNYYQFVPKHLYAFAHQILLALDYCHKHNVAHRDIKPANILIDRYGRPKLADFGISRHVNAGALGHSVAGSRAFMAPEIINNKPYDYFKADVWALGVTFYALAAGRTPWPEDATKKAIDLAISMGMINYPHDMDKPFAKFLHRMLVTKPLKRATVADLLSDPIFTGNKFITISKSNEIIGNQYNIGKAPSFRLDKLDKKALPISPSYKITTTNKNTINSEPIPQSKTFDNITDNVLNQNNSEITLSQMKTTKSFRIIGLSPAVQSNAAQRRRSGSVIQTFVD